MAKLSSKDEPKEFYGESGDISEVFIEDTRTAPESETPEDGPEPEAQAFEDTADPEPDSNDFDFDSFEDVSDRIKSEPMTVARGIVRMVDTVQKVVLPPWVYAANFSQAEHEALQMLLAKTRAQNSGIDPDKVEGVNVSISAEDLRLLNKYADHQDYIKSIPFEDTEKQELEKAVGDYLQTLNFEISPGWVLIGTAAFTMGPRWLPLLKNWIGGLFEGKPKKQKRLEPKG